MYILAPFESSQGQSYFCMLNADTSYKQVNIMSKFDFK